MIVHFKNFTLDVSKPILANLNLSSENEVEALKIIKKWLAGELEFEFKTSGSTGNPKLITAKRIHLEASAKRTLNFFSISSGIILNCLPAKHIGGAMQIIRALTGQLDLQILEPAKNPFESYTIPWKNISLVSLVPYQLSSILKLYKSEFSQAKAILLGGAAPDMKLIKQCKAANLTNVYETYGMTETLSHVAVKNLVNGKFFEGLEGVSFTYSAKKTLNIHDKKLEIESLETNDCVEIDNPKSFTFLGRNDNVINSGGIKLHPENIEKKFSQHIASSFFVFSQPHPEFGESLCLLIEGKHEILDLKELLKNDPNISNYEIPKAVFYLANFSYTETHKINRKLTISRI